MKQVSRSEIQSGVIPHWPLELKDRNGVTAHFGDVLLSCRGGHGDRKGRHSDWFLWQYQGQKNTEGVRYNIAGDSFTFFHAHVSSSLIITEAPFKLIWGFYRGLQSFVSPLPEETKEVAGLIDSGDWQKNLPNKKVIESYQRLKEIEFFTKQDVVAHAGLLESIPTWPNALFEKLCWILGIRRNAQELAVLIREIYLQKRSAV